MCGGQGTRLDAGEKPLFEIGGEPMVDRVLAALDKSALETVYAVTSPHAPETATHLDGRVPCLETGGDGYVEDLGVALDDRRVGRPVVTVVSDLPLLTPEIVDRVVDAYDGGALTVCVPTALKEALGVSAETTRAHGGHERSPTGLNVVGETTEETLYVSYDTRLAINVNRPEDVAVAEVLCEP